MKSMRIIERFSTCRGLLGSQCRGLLGSQLNFREVSLRSSNSFYQSCIFSVAGEFTQQDSLFPSLDQLHIFDDSIVFSLTSIFWFYDAVFFSLYDISRKIIWYVNCRGISPFITQMALVSDRDNNFHRSIIFSMYIVQARCSFCGKIQCTSLLLFVLLLLLRCSWIFGL